MFKTSNKLVDGILSEESLEIAINDFMSTTTQFSEQYKQWVDNIQGSISNKKLILFDV